VLFVGPVAPAGLEPVATLPSVLRLPAPAPARAGPRPPAYVVECERPAEGDALAAVLDPGFDPRAEVLLADAALASAVAGVRHRAGDSSARVVTRTADTLDVAVSSARQESWC
jgi:hypothetical protein